jgi:hypothetical protein
MFPNETFTTNYNNSIELIFDSNIKHESQQIYLKCIIVYNDIQKIVINGNNWFSCTIPASISHSHSQYITVTPTFDGINSLANESNFTLAIIAPSPQIIQNKSFVSEDGLYIVIFFDRPVDVFINPKMHSQESCDFLLTNKSISELKKFGLISCKWSTKVQLIISLNLPINKQFITISFNEKTFKESAQKISLYNMEIIEVIVNKLNSNSNEWSYETRVALIGPTLMPICGTFTLNGYFSSPKGSNGVKFKWSIITLPPRYDLISGQLLELIDSNDRINLLLDANYFSVDLYSYRFKLTVKLSDQTIIEASHQIFKYNYHLPIVTIFPSTLLASQQFTVDQRYVNYSHLIIKFLFYFIC